jgi:hypothetical protein
MGLHYYGLRATNAGYSVDFLNLIPVVTFVTAVILRYVTFIALLLFCFCLTLLHSGWGNYLQN